MPAEINSTVWGIAPWSDDLLRISGDVDRGRANEYEFLGQLSEDFGVYFEALRAAGIRYCDGDWGGGTRDYFRQTVLSSEGFEDGIHDAPVTRLFDTNTFFRRPTIEGPLTYRQGDRHGLFKLYEDAPGSPDTYQPAFLSPYAFAKLAARSGDVSEEDALRFVSGLYDGLLDEAAAQDVTHVLLHEPYAPYHQVDGAERDELRRTVGGLAANHPGLEVGIYFGYGDAAGLVRDFADDGRLAAVGCDLRRTPIAGLPEVPGQRFLAGLVDGGNTLIRGDDEIIAELEAVEAAVGAPEISVTHTVDLQFVPRTYALEKIAQLGRIAGDRKGAGDE